jgi:hypothetical protein
VWQSLELRRRESPYRVITRCTVLSERGFSVIHTHVFLCVHTYTYLYILYRCETETRDTYIDRGWGEI